MRFANPSMLWALWAVAIPILIHLIHLRRYRKVYFSNVDALAEMVSQQRRHDRLRRWLVLAARVLAVVFIVLAFARPVWRPSAEASVEPSAIVSIYLDNSFSSTQQASAGTLLDEGRLRAREVAMAYPISTRFQLLTSDLAGQQMRLLGRDELLLALDEVHPSAASPTVSEVLTRQSAFMQQMHASAFDSYVISDFQRSQCDLEAVRPDSLRSLHWVRLQGEAMDNLYVDTVVLDAPAYRVGGGVAATATVVNSGRHDAEHIPVRLIVDGHQRAVATLDVPAHSQARCTLHFTIEHEGNIDASVQIDDYPLVFDDQYYFALRAGQPIHVMELHGGEPNPYVGRLFAQDSLMLFSSAARIEQELSQCDLILLTEKTRMESGESQQLLQWVREGGTLVVSPAADGRTPEQLNSLLQSMGAPRLERWLSSPLKANHVEVEAALYRGVFSSTSDEMEMPLTQGHYQLGRTPYAAQPLISLSNGDPLLLASSVGEGTVYLFTSPLREEQNSLVRQALFVPTLYNMALFSTPLPPASFSLDTRLPIPLQDRYDPSLPPPDLLLPSGQSLLPDLRTVGNRQAMMLHGEVVEDGICILNEEHIAFNYPRRESQMDFLSVEELTQATHQMGKAAVMTAGVRSLTDVIHDSSQGHPLWRWCLVIALAMLAIEIILIRTNR